MDYLDHGGKIYVKGEVKRPWMWVLIVLLLLAILAGGYFLNRKLDDQLRQQDDINRRLDGMGLN